MNNITIRKIKRNQGIVKKVIDFLKTRFQEDLERDSGLYWKLSSQDSRIRDQSHWRSVRRWDNDRWFEYGDFHFGLISKYLRLFAPDDYRKNLGDKIALEWGCGGGSNVRVLCRNFHHVYGTDVSEATLAECERQMEDLDFHNFQAVLFPSEDPEATLDVIKEEAVDFILSVAVFQHFPSKSYSLRILNIIEKLLKKNAYALIQIRYFDGSEKLRQKNHNYARNVVYMTSFTHDEFSEQIRESGLTVLQRERNLDDERDCHEYYFVRK